MRTPKHITIHDTTTGDSKTFRYHDDWELSSWINGQIPGADEATLDVSAELVDLIISGRALSRTAQEKAHYLALTVDAAE